MARELDITIAVNDQGAKQALVEVDHGLEQTAATATRAGEAISQVEAKLGSARAQITATTAAQKALNDEMAREAKWKAFQGQLDGVAAATQAVATQTRTLETQFGRTYVTAAEAEQALSEMHTTLAQMPSTLTRIGAGLGLTVDNLGLFTSAALVVGTAVESWRLGRAIAEFFDLDTAIAHTTATLVGWGDVVAQTAGAKADVLALASQRAGYGITNLTEAMQVNERWAQQWSDHWARLDGPRQSTQQVAIWHNEIAGVEKDGVLKSLTRDLQSNNFSMKDLAERYRVSAGALALYRNELKQTADEERKRDQMLREFQQREHEREQRLAHQAQERDQSAVQQYHAQIGGSERALMANQGNYGAGEQLARITMLQKAEHDLTAAVYEQLTSEKERMKLVEDFAKRYLDLEAQKIAKQREITAGINAQITAESAAQAAIMAKFGVGPNGAPLMPGNDPLTRAQQQLDALHKNAAPGVSTSAREQQIYDEFTKAAQEGATVITGMTAAERDATAAASSVSKAHLDASQAAVSATSAFAQFTTSVAGQMPTVDIKSGMNVSNTDPRVVTYMSMGYTQGEAIAKAMGYGTGIGMPQHRAGGGPVNADEPYLVGERGPEMFVPKGTGSIVPNGAMGGGIGSIVVNIKGNVDSEVTARRMADQVADQVMRRIKSQGRVTYSKA
jgi:hypothetical protein